MKKLLLTLAPLATITPLATISCVNPFRDNQTIKKARNLHTKNNLLNNKSIDEFKKILKDKNIYSSEDELNEVIKAFENSFKQLRASYFVSLDQFREFWQINNLVISNYYTKEDQNGQIVHVKVPLKKEVIQLFAHYIFAKSPFGYSLLHKEQKLIKDLVANEDSIKFEGPNSPISNSLENYVIIPKLLSERMYTEEFYQNATIDSFTKAYTNVMKVLSKFVYGLGEEETNTTNALLPIYYLLKNPKDNPNSADESYKYVDNMYTSNAGGEWALFKPEILHSLNEKDYNSLIDEMSKDILKFAVKYIKEDKISNQFIYSHLDGLSNNINQYKKGIGSYGLAELVAYSLYSINPTNIQILATTKNNKTVYMVQFVDKEGNSVLVNPSSYIESVADKNKRLTTDPHSSYTAQPIKIYRTKVELNNDGYTLVDDQVISNPTHSKWK
ncbi:hypothetical protein MCAL160_0358 [Mycoplasmopsis californica HAZ160_1]|uniref:Lipoprotein n=1 Tax=Mycoplasmopsis californica HAZ160_1 TaxID=1397850 RepID=A0AAT9F7V9_9BACT|nr:hypothetical protein [Mycoplasmopsis californica]BAP00972.1 hypothetical protein MCAL160_0358 [Mycoplasmopsis californica HAZ160_1]BBG40836.1 hypothetical protein MCAL106_0358 [Mycoplasmopsis californica]BBG41430.1 hypothetical protein MCAL106E_0358 [Mycoplasmopsis californica]BBG42023.1 hypothetical protein MCAL106L_0358 [Mycoplasmopsis californica]BBG42607.1 hypothetical protein MCAL160E_0358 [Mycoplasmopsis californica]